MNAQDISADELGRKADGSDLLGHAVRVGLVAYGVVHLLIAWVALQLALGSEEGAASGEGALHQMASNPFGGVALAVTAAGFGALVLWQLIEAIGGHRNKDGGARTVKRLGSAMKVVLYGSLGVTALRIVLGDRSKGGGTDTMTSELMAVPGGQILVGLVGVVIVAYAGRLVWRGLSEGFKKHLETEGCVGNAGRAFVTLGKVGYVSKGVALLPVAGLFVWAAWTHDAQKSGGLDVALHKVLQQPFGSPALIAIAVGIAAFGLFCFAWARHLDR